MFLLDSNIFIESKKHFCAPDICPAFWQWLSEESCSSNSIKSISNVLDELKAGNDDLPKWAQKMLPSDFFIETARDGRIIEEWRTMQDALLSSSHFESVKVRPFLEKADLWLIAAAKVYEGCVVTNEYVRSGQKRIKIPAVAAMFGVKCCTIYDVMRTLGVRFPSYDREGEKRELVFSEGRFIVPTRPSFGDIFSLDS